MRPPERTANGESNRCPVCGQPLVLDPGAVGREIPCPGCGQVFWVPRTSGLEAGGAFPVYTISSTQGVSKEQVIALVVDRLIASKFLPAEQRQGIVHAILRREGLGSTGIGQGVAIPHATYPGVERLVGAVARFPEGIDFASLDAEPVHTVCMFIAPTGRPGEYLRMLEAAARYFRGDV